jgi:hypothetical protein
MQWTPKSPEDSRLYSYDLSEIYPDTIDTAVFTRASGTVTLTAVDPDPRTAYVIVAGGAAAETATLSLVVTTAQGQSFTRSISLKIVTGADSLGPDSSITKGTLVVRALGKLGIANYVFDTEAEEDNSALRQLDSMAARWQDKLDGLSYVQPASNGQSLPSDASGIDEADVDAFISNLAITLAPDYGKTPAPQLNKVAAESRSEIFTKYARRIEYRLPSRLATGAGNDRSWRPRFFNGC